MKSECGALSVNRHNAELFAEARRPQITDRRYALILFRVLKWGALFLALLLALGVGFVFYVYNERWYRLPTQQDILSHYTSTEVAGADTFIPLSKFPNHVRLAVLAAENSNYLVDGSAWGRCLWLAIKSVSQTGRTPTNLYGCGHNFPKRILSTMFPIESPARRSLSMAVYVRKAETVLTREQIFAWLLNKAYFGSNSYGISQAADTFYRKPAEKLTIAQAAMLAGLLKAPSRYSPIRDPSRARKRRDQVLLQMLERGMISSRQYQTALSEELGQSP